MIVVVAVGACYPLRIAIRSDPVVLARSNDRTNPFWYPLISGRTNAVGIALSAHRSRFRGTCSPER